MHQVYSNDNTKNFRELHGEYYDHNCDKVLSMQIPEKEGGFCWRTVKNVPVVVPIPALEEALVQGLDFFTRTTYIPDPVA
jgi:hypothetical protein